MPICNNVKPTKPPHFLVSAGLRVDAKLCAQLRPIMATIGQPGCFRMRAAHQWFVSRELSLTALAKHSRANPLQILHLHFPIAS
jgi:hypothetical protein